MSQKKSYDILGVHIDAVTMDESLSTIESWINEPTGEAHYVVKPYVEFITRAQKDTEVRTALNASQLSVADGVSLQWAASYLYGEPGSRPSIVKLTKSLLAWVQKDAWRNQILPEKFAGITYTRRLLSLAAQRGWRVGVIGGSDTPAAVKSALEIRWPKLNLVDVWTGYTDTTTNMRFGSWESDEKFTTILNAMEAAHLDLLCVGMGFPRQELFMHAFADTKLAKVMVGEGGSFDYQEMGGKLKRAPKSVRKLGLEWLWRLVLQPSRIKRQMAIPRYIWAVHSQARRDWLQKKR